MRCSTLSGTCEQKPLACQPQRDPVRTSAAYGCAVGCNSASCARSHTITTMVGPHLDFRQPAGALLRRSRPLPRRRSPQASGWTWSAGSVPALSACRTEVQSFQMAAAICERAAFSVHTNSTLAHAMLVPVATVEHGRYQLPGSARRRSPAEAESGAPTPARSTTARVVRARFDSSPVIRGQLRWRPIRQP